jgi:hypothetical protein
MYEMIINVDKSELLSVLEANRARHRTVFGAALDGYKREALRVLRDQIKAIEAGETPALHLILDRPEDHTRDYDRVIGMLKMDKSDTFRLDQGTFKNYVDDDWSWTRQWAKMSSSYAPASYTQNYETVDDDEGDDGF